MISEQDFERLSAYVDDALAAAEKSALEARLQREPELKAALRDLRLQARALRALPPLRPPRNFTLSARQAQTLRPARTSAFASLFPALRLATAVSAFAFVAVLAANFATASQGSLAVAPAAAPAVEATRVAEAEQPFSAAAATAEVGALTAPTEKQAPTPAGTQIAEAIPSARIITDTVTADAVTPAAESGLAQIVTETPAPTQQLFLPNVASEPERPASAPPLSPLALGAVVLGVITLVLALATWLARRG